MLEKQSYQTKSGLVLRRLLVKIWPEKLHIRRTSCYWQIDFASCGNWLSCQLQNNKGSG